MHSEKQLSFVVAPRVLLRFHRARQPPDATGPFEWGAFAATLAGRPQLRGWGRTELQAITGLATLLRGLVDERPTTPRLTAFGQALTAAERLSAEALVTYLGAWAEEPVLA